MLKLLLEDSTGLGDVEVISGGFNRSSGCKSYFRRIQQVLWMLKLLLEDSTGLVDVEVISGGFNRSCGC